MRLRNDHAGVASTTGGAKEVRGECVVVQAVRRLDIQYVSEGETEERHGVTAEHRTVWNA